MYTCVSICKSICACIRICVYTMKLRDWGIPMCMCMCICMCMYTHDGYSTASVLEDDVLFGGNFWLVLYIHIYMYVFVRTLLCTHKTQRTYSHMYTQNTIYVLCYAYIYISLDVWPVVYTHLYINLYVMNMYIRTHMHIYTNVSIDLASSSHLVGQCTYTHTYTHICICKHICNICTHIRIHVYTCIGAVYIYSYMYILGQCTYTHICICKRICNIYTHIRIHVYACIYS